MMQLHPIYDILAHLPKNNFPYSWEIIYNSDLKEEQTHKHDIFTHMQKHKFPYS